MGSEAGLSSGGGVGGRPAPTVFGARAFAALACSPSLSAPMKYECVFTGSSGSVLG